MAGEDKARVETVHVTGFGDTEAEARDDVMERGREFFGSTAVEAVDYNGDPPRWYPGSVQGTHFASRTDKKIYLSAYIRRAAGQPAGRPQPEPGRVHGGEYRWRVSGTGRYWDTFWVQATTMAYAEAKVSDILFRTDARAQVRSIVRENLADQPSKERTSANDETGGL